MISSDLTLPRRLAAPSSIVLAVIALVGCGSTKTVTTTTPHNTTEQPATTGTTPPPTQATCTKPCADASGWIVEVSNFKYDVKSGNEFITPESGNVFVTMDVKFTNNSKSSHSASLFDFKLKSAGVDHNPEGIGPCESWSSVDVGTGASYGPKCLSFQAAAGKPTGIVLVWTPGLVKGYEIPLEGAAPSGGASAGAETNTGASGTTASLPNHCSSGLSTTQGVPCELANNMFYEYYKAVQNGKDTTALMVWSPAVKQYRTANCSKGSGVITCHISGTNVPNAQVQITQAALDAYTPEHASEYAKTHDLGPQG